jgi:hypothetical protein
VHGGPQSKARATLGGARSARKRVDLGPENVCTHTSVRTHSVRDRGSTSSPDVPAMRAAQPHSAQRTRSAPGAEVVVAHGEQRAQVCAGRRRAMAIRRILTWWRPECSIATAMQRRIALGCLALLLSCKSGSDAPQASPSVAESGPAPQATPVAPALPTLPTMGGTCSPGADSVACTADGVQEVTCASSVWRTLRACRGPAGCKGVGSSLRCDPGTPQIGDPCIPGATPAACAGSAIRSCQAGKWAESPCAAPATCRADAGGGQAACK